MKKAEIQAEELLQRLGLSVPPVPVERVARECGAHLAFEHLDGDLSGLLFRGEERTVIGVNSAHAQVRQRFTIAHEIGHMLMHEGKPMFVDKLVRVNLRDSDSSLGSIQEEKEANAFAAALLMPRSMIEASLTKDRQVKGDALIDGLAEQFEVSRQAMEYRLINLGLIVAVPN